MKDMDRVEQAIRRREAAFPGGHHDRTALIVLLDRERSKTAAMLAALKLAEPHIYGDTGGDIEARRAVAAAINNAEGREWSGSPCPDDPDNYWIDDETGERVPAPEGR
jgi:hypothetical protein